MSNDNLNSLPPGTRINDYVIDKVLGAGGFGITYLVTDTNLRMQLAVKEFFPAEIAIRQDKTTVYPKTEKYEDVYIKGIERFLDEARNLAKFRNHPNIVSVNRVFQENGTAYFVMEYAEGESLEQHIQKMSEPIKEEELLRIFHPMLEALKVLHTENLIHRDIAPDNILLVRGGTPILIDFGASRYSMGQESRNLTSILKPGYAPFEQYQESGKKQGPWTDLYALAGTMYHCMTGHIPLKATDRAAAILEDSPDPLVPVSVVAKGKYGQNVLSAVDKALSMKTTDRPQSVIEFQDLLESEDPPPIPIPPPPPLPRPLPPPSPQKIKCKRCGVTVKASASHCNQCGKDLSDILESVVVNDPEKKSYAWVWVTIVVLIVTLISGRIWFRNQEIQSALQHAEDLLVLKAYAGAYEAFMDVLELDADNSRALTSKNKIINDVVKQAKTLREDHEYFEAYKKYNSVLVMDEDNQSALTAIGNIPSSVLNRANEMKSLGRWQYAIKYYRQTTEIIGSRITISEDIVYCQMMLNAVNASFIRNMGTAEKKHTEPVYSVDFNKDGNTLASCGGDGKIYFWNIFDGSYITELFSSDSKSWYRSIEYSPDGNLLAIGLSNGYVYSWNISGDQAGDSWYSSISIVNSVAISPNGKFLACGSNDNEVKLRWLASGILIKTNKHSNYVNSVAFSPDSRFLASGSWDDKIKLWNTSDGSHYKTFDANSDVNVVAFSPDGKNIASGSDDKTIRLWRLSDNRLLHKMKNQTSYIYSVAFSPDGRLLASGSKDKTIVVWEVETGKELKKLTGHIGAVRSITFSPDGKYLASGSEDETVKLWGPFK